jgi:hypothetical protein
MMTSALPGWLRTPPSGNSLLFRCVLVVMVGEFVAVWLLRATGSWWGSRTPDAIRTAPYRFMGGAVAYFHPTVGWLLNNGLWIFGALLGLLLVVKWLERNRSEHKPGAA